MSLIFIAAMAVSCTHSEKKSDKIEERVEQLLAKMTLDDKIGQMTQVDPGFAGGDEQLKKSVRDGRYGSILNLWGVEKVNEIQKIAVEESRLGIPLLIGRDVIHGYRTIFPIPLGMAASWNPDMVKKAFRISAIECSSQGIKWTFAPMIDITWDPRWGRIAEGCGEDPYLASTLSKAMVEGIQGDNLTDPTAVAACAKHFAGYGFSEGGRDYNTTYISEPVLRNVVLKPFKAAKDAGALTFMSGFNDLNGVPATGNEFILRQILRNEWEFQGMVVSDWSSVSEMISHGFCANEKDAALKALKGGVDMEMSSLTYAGNLKTLLTEGKIDQKLLDDAVRNILRVKFKLGLFENPYTNPEAQKQVLNPEFLDQARIAAMESAVLLKNKNKTLPLSPKIHSVAIIGPLADSPRDQLGTWVFDGKAENSVTPLTAFKAQLEPDKINYIKGLQYSRDKNKSEFAKAVALAKQSDAIVYFGGEEWILSGEGQCRGEINLPGAQDELIDALASSGKPLIVVIMAGRPLAIGNVLAKADAVLYGWHGGTMAGPALVDLIFGKESPSGKLPVTFVKGSGQIPFYYYHNNTGRPASAKNWMPMDSIPVVNPQTSLGYKSFQLDYGFTPLLPFGFGLSYTTFNYSDLRLSSMSMSTSGSIEVKAIVANSGDMDADEIVQFYIRDRVGSITRPVKELKGYKRINIKQGENVEVVFNLQAKDLSFFNGKANVIEPGEFDVWIGPNSAEGLHGEFTIH
ncbi:MAG: glycoside hydrolase family 3 C-terminal domain-containing protein [Prolixibacteraceae bacterium]|nr:glycoside hydrolase family 3 C-terminal domain-containing protein [Prolixibacteraceae bacterium]